VALETLKARVHILHEMLKLPFLPLRPLPARHHEAALSTIDQALAIAKQHDLDPIMTSLLVG
jgi:hypothetical protein